MIMFLKCMFCDPLRELPSDLSKITITKKEAVTDCTLTSKGEVSICNTSCKSCCSQNLAVHLVTFLNTHSREELGMCDSCFQKIGKVRDYLSTL